MGWHNHSPKLYHADAYELACVASVARGMLRLAVVGATCSTEEAAAAAAAERTVELDAVMLGNAGDSVESGGRSWADQKEEEDKGKGERAGKLFWRRRHG